MANILDRILQTKKATVETTEIQRVGVQTLAPRRSADTAGLISASTKNELAYACIEIKRKAMQDPRLVVETKDKDGTWKEEPAHPFQRLMMRPLKPDRTSAGMDGATFLGLQVASWDIARVFYAEKIRSRAGATIGLNPLNPGYMSPWYDTSRTQIGYTWKRGLHRVDFPYEELLVREDPSWGGASPLSVALGAIDTDTAQTDFIRAFFNNGGQPGGIIKIKEGRLSQEQSDILSAKWTAKYGRGGNGWQQPAVLDETVDYQRVGAMLSELGDDGIRGLVESRICAPFGVPPLIVYAYVGLLRATYSNLKEAWASFWDAELSPALKALREFLTWNLLTEFVSEDLIYSERIRLRWDLSQVAALMEDVDGIHRRAEASFRAGGITLNEYRSEIGKPPDTTGDYYLRGIALVAEPANEVPIDVVTVTTSGKRSVGPSAIKAMKKRSTAKIEKQMEKELAPMIASWYTRMAEAVQDGAT